jgi:hypothetical protein
MMIGIGTPSSQSKIPLPMIHPSIFRSRRAFWRDDRFARWSALVVDARPLLVEHARANRRETGRAEIPFGGEVALANAKRDVESTRTLE